MPSREILLSSAWMRIFSATVLFFLSGFLAAAGEPGFRRFADTISPDGAYVLAWGWGDEEHPENLKEWPPGQDSAGDFVANYLLDAVGGRVLATIPQRDYFRASDGSWRRFSGLAVAWSEDSQHALAIYEGRWSDEAILWIGPKLLSFVDVLGPLDKAYRDLLAKKEKLAEAGEIGFSRAALLPDGGLVIHAHARPQVNRPREYHYRLKFLVKLGGPRPIFALVSGRKIPPADDDNDDAVEDDLNKAYQTLRAKLDETGRTALQEKQRRWLKQRESLGPDVNAALFTRMRTAYLRARSEN
jgi:hypothetical protein